MTASESRAFTLIDRCRGSVATVDRTALGAALGEAVAEGPAVIGVCGHAGFRVPDVRYLAPIAREVSDRTATPLRLEPALADARHSSDDRGCSPLRVHVEIVQPSETVATLKDRLRLRRDDDPYVSQIPFGAPKRHPPDGISHRHVLDCYRRLLSGDLYRWVSFRVMAAAQRTVDGAGGTLLDFHRHFRDVLLAEQLGGVTGLELTPTIATAHPADFREHILRTHQGQAAIAVDLLRDRQHAREVVTLFQDVAAREPRARLPRWLFAPVEPACYVCRGFGPPRVAHGRTSALAASG